MKKIIALIILALSPYIVSAQSCEKKSCGPEGTKVEEAAVITSMRDDLQTVITKISKSSLAFDNQLKGMTIEKGASDDESLMFMSQIATLVRYEFLNKLEAAKLTTSLKDYKPSPSSTKQQMVATLKKEIQLLASQAEAL